MPLQHRNVFGYGVAALGAAVVAAACVFLGLKIVDSVALIVTLVLVGCALIAMGMYVVLPQETSGAIDQIEDLADKIPFNVLRRGERARSAEPPVVVSPAAGQSTIVNPPAAAPVLVTPGGEAKSLERAGDAELVAERRRTGDGELQPIPTGADEYFGPLSPLEEQERIDSLADETRRDAIDALGIAQLPPTAPAPAPGKPGRRGLPQPDYTYPPGDA
jgi:hypothetical protein